MIHIEAPGTRMEGVHAVPPCLCGGCDESVALNVIRYREAVLTRARSWRLAQPERHELGLVP